MDVTGVRRALISISRDMEKMLTLTVPVWNTSSACACARLRCAGWSRARQSCWYSAAKVIPAHMRREGMDQETLEAALREHGVADLEDVEMAVLEIDGSISVVPVGAGTKRVKRPVKFLRHQ
jgi:hypothetical protein